MILAEVYHLTSGPNRLAVILVWLAIKSLRNKHSFEKEMQPTTNLTNH
jgi:hypothetical protein